MISVLLNIFDSRPSLLSLIKLMIEREVAQTGTFSSLENDSFLTPTKIPRRTCSEEIQRVLDSSRPLRDCMDIITLEVSFSLFSAPWLPCQLEPHTKSIRRRQWAKMFPRIKRISNMLLLTSFRSSRHRFPPFQGEKYSLVKMLKSDLIVLGCWQDVPRNLCPYRACCVGLKKSRQRHHFFYHFFWL